MVQSRNVGGVEISIRGDNSSFKREMRETERVARRGGDTVSRSFDRANRSVTVLNNSLVRSRTSMLALGAAAGIALTSSTRLIANFEQSMSTVQAVTNATAEEFEALTKRARELGSTTRFTASQAAGGMIELARAGFSVDEVMGSIEGTLQLAQAGALDLSRASEITAGTLRGMRLDVSETSRVVDVLSLAANSSNTNVSQLGDALKFVTPISAGLGVSLEETAGAIQALSDSGFRGELAGTGLRKVMISLEKQSKEGIGILASYGLTLDDVSISSNGLIPALQKLADAGITTGEAMTLFGLRGGPAFEILRSSVPKVEAATAALQDAEGTAAQIAETMDDNLNGAILRSVSALQDLVLAIGDTGPTQALESSLNGLATLLNVASENADILGVAFVALSARAILPLVASAVPRLITGVTAANVALVNLTRTAGVAAAATRVVGTAMAFVGGPATIAITAAAAAFVVLGRDAERGRQALEDARVAIEGAQAALEATDKYDDTFYNLTESAAQSIPVFNQVAEAIRGVSKALEGTSIAGFVNDATQLYNTIQENKSVLADLEARQADALAAQVRDPTSSGQDRVAIARQLGLETEFDDEIVRARQAIAILELRLQSIGKNVFGEIDILETLQNGGLDELERVLKARLEKLNEEAGLTIADGVDTNGDSNNVIDERAQKLQQILDIEYQLDIARAKNDEKEIARLEDKLEIIARTEDLVRAGLTLADAEVKAREQVNNLRATENQLIRDQLRDQAVRESLSFGEDPDSPTSPESLVADYPEVDFAAERVKDGVSEALLQAVQGGDWQEALGRTFYDVVSDSLRESFDDILSQLGTLLTDAISGGFGSPGFGGGIFDFFAGNRASGGSVTAGRRYLIGERGPEMFVPNSDGNIVSNEDLRASGNPGKPTGGGVGSIRMGDIVVNGDPSGRTLKLIAEAQRQQAEQLPSLIDQRVQESSTRGRYG